MSLPVLALRRHLGFTALCGLMFLALFALLRLLLLFYNAELWTGATWRDALAAFGNGLRFDARVTAWILLPLIVALLIPRAMANRRWMRAWLTFAASLMLFLGVIELDFYREFQQRLNGLVFQYLEEDPGTVLSMLWHGFPVLRLLLGWALATAFCYLLWRGLDRRLPCPGGVVAAPWTTRCVLFLLCFLLAALAVRGTLRQGPPLRWGDAYTTDSMFANQLGLNGALSLFAAAQQHWSAHRDNAWKALLPAAEARALTRQMVLTPEDQLVDADTAALRREMDFPPSPTIKNVVVILMESFAARHVGVLGGDDGITPRFDALIREGVLFTRFFSNGTHTHQGMFATMACFPNLPGFEYLMQMPEGAHRFSGLPQLLNARGYADLYLYNGDFAWDNQLGFFGNQGMRHFVGRHDFVDPVVADPTWGVADQDMFARGVTELDKLAAGEKPFYALIQTLSNHTPYALPDPLPTPPVTGHGALDRHLTAMRYADWALGEFFDAIREKPWYRETLFVLLGDHAFGANEQLTEINLGRFHVPLLLIAPGLRERLGETRDTVASQVDVVPTVMGLLGGRTRHQCWGRDLLHLPEGDPGFAVFKPSGGDQMAAIAHGDRVLVKPQQGEARLYVYALGVQPRALRLQEPAVAADLQRRLEAYIQTATESLLGNQVSERRNTTN